MHGEEEGMDSQLAQVHTKTKPLTFSIKENNDVSLIQQSVYQNTAEHLPNTSTHE